MSGRWHDHKSTVVDDGGTDVYIRVTHNKSTNPFSIPIFHLNRITRFSTNKSVSPTPKLQSKILLNHDRYESCSFGGAREAFESNDN